MRIRALEIWRAFDRTIIRGTEAVLFAAGITFTAFLVVGMIGRYIADYSVSFVEAGARFLLVWFFFLGAGLALRQKMHVGFDLLRALLPSAARKYVAILAHLCVLLFSGLVLAGAVPALQLSATHTEPALGISAFWAILAVPVGVALMAYHQLCVIFEERAPK